MKTLSKALFVAYIVILIWVVLFKFSYDLIGVIQTYHSRGLDLIPSLMNGKSEMISNIIAFIPLGIMLSVYYKRLSVWRRLAIVIAFSVVLEVIQYTLAIGVSDITDVIMNTLGGLLGIVTYLGASKVIKQFYIDRFITIIGFIVLSAILYLRLFVFMVRY